ncbi:unnamed protein product [Polarella glacialis]|uniref:Uncharacterized protein n=1 Tax=Polarella glacialis TaxID=89957 RepID=A0A813DI46_POLGL|nr:unnamed protein product [Polarella glacialis]
MHATEVGIDHATWTRRGRTSTVSVRALNLAKCMQRKSLLIMLFGLREVGLRRCRSAHSTEPNACNESLSQVPSRTLSADRSVMKQLGGLRHPLLGQGAQYSTTLEHVSPRNAKQPSWCTKPQSTT